MRVEAIAFMSSDAERKKGPRKRRAGKDGRNMFGEYILTYCTLLEIDRAELARRARISESTLSHASAKNASPSPATVRKVWKALCEIAREQGRWEQLCTPEAERNFYNSGDRVTAEQKQGAGHYLTQLRQNNRK
jgi:transcriptional regulator with XRE-family HTH domain